MNQILFIKATELKSRKKIKHKEMFYSKYNVKIYKLQLILSLLIVCVLLSFVLHYFYCLYKNELYSNNLISNYNIYKLYNSKPYDSDLDYSKRNITNNIFGIIEIPKINLYYPVFSYLNDDLLKISPCKFYGDFPDKNGNICIAGHNYDNSLFFSKIQNLSNDDLIIIYDINNRYDYYVYSKYEVNESDFSPIFKYDKNKKILTLITCNNLNSNRIVIKAKQN